MSHPNHYAPQFKSFSWLRAQGAMDASCERALKMISRRHRRVLVCGNPGSGKNTIANSLFAYWQETGREAFFTPTVSCKAPGDLRSSPEWKSYRSCFTGGRAAITPMRYEQEFYGEQCLPGIFSSARHYDVLVDCRRLPDGTRMVAQIFFRRGRSWRCLYRSPLFAKLQIGASVAA